uniref:ISXO2-like transposase domain-containing protein n=1 Tax=Amphimedon queenslandica TaxID=400682 RepID=A0A1X7VI93_AMPQE
MVPKMVSCKVLFIVSGFGLADTSHTPALGYMHVVQSRVPATLLPIICYNVAPRTVIHSDEWGAYRRVAQLPNISCHATVNHSVEFVAPNGVHT